MGTARGTRCALPQTIDVYDKRMGQNRQNRYATIVFPKTGYALNRPQSHFNPDAYTHGGISMQELMIPMVVLKVKTPDDGLLSIDQVAGPAEMVEGEEAEFRLRIGRSAAVGAARVEEMRVDCEATVMADKLAEHEATDRDLPKQVAYVGTVGTELVFRFRLEPSDATDDERRAGSLSRLLTITVAYRDGRKIVRKSRTHRFTAKLNSEQVVRRVGNLGNILGLTPRNMR